MTNTKQNCEEIKNRSIVTLVWNGCDNYILSDKSVFTQKDEFKPFNVVEVYLNELPLDAEGEPDVNGVLSCENGKLYFNANQITKLESYI